MKVDSLDSLVDSLSTFPRPSILFPAGKEKVQFWRLNTVQEATPNMGIPRAAGLKEYTVADLKIATNNFGTFLDEGSFGNVYKGWVNEKTLAPSESEIGMAVAIKISTYSKTNSKHFEQWQNSNVKLSNFGLATREPHDEELPVTSSMLTSTNNTPIIGTFGYCAPECLLTGKVYIKSDVYSFGVVLLELLTGLKSIDHNRPDGEQSLVYWLEPKLSNKINLKSIMDMHMEGQYSITAAFQAAELTKKCLDSNPENRPNMRQVVELLKQIKAMEEETKNSKN